MTDWRKYKKPTKRCRCCRDWTKNYSICSDEKEKNYVMCARCQGNPKREENK